jgi:sigma-B regulation protein RsbU (phosphoserine phosphatase)
MYALEITAEQVLQTFHGDAPYLFLGAAFVSVGMIAAAFSLIRSKHDAVLNYFALFSVLYGLRLWVQASTVGLAFQDSAFYPRLAAGINYIVPIPAFLFFDAAGLLHRGGKIVGYVFEVILGTLAVLTFALGPSPAYLYINNGVVIVALVALVVQSLWQGAENRDFVIVRRGLLLFVACALYDNIAGPLWRVSRIEPYGFVAFLGALGYVAARQTLARDQQLNDIQKELEVARRIQMSILPGQFPESTSFRVAARYLPMTSVAGDFYDFIVADDRQVGLLIADVSGHGVPAALIASMVKLAATAQRGNAGDPSGLLSGMNAALCGNTQNQFVTAAYVYLDSEARELRYSAAGHPPMLLLRDRKVQEVKENGLMLAAFDFATYSTASHKLEPGDRLLLYTDGIVEAASARGEFFGQEALGALLRQTAESPPTDAVDQIISAVQQWAVTQDDDLTVLVCDYVGTRKTLNRDALN